MCDNTACNKISCTGTTTGIINLFLVYRIQGFHIGDYEDYCLSECDAV
jgi:hypothetical protein